MSHTFLSGETAVDIANSVERAVRLGLVLPGDRLPSVRDAGLSLGVSRNTVASAYARLRDAGILIGGPGRGGMRIARIHPFEGRALELPSGACDLASGNIDASFLPPLAQVLDRVDLGSSGYDAEADDPGLVALVRERLGYEGLDTRHMCFVSGALDAIERAMRAQLRPGAYVLVEDPGFPPLFDLLRSLGARLKPMPMDQEGPLPDAVAALLRGGAAAVVLTPRAQNPTGADISPARAQALARLFAEHPDVLIVIDDHWGPLSENSLALLPPRHGRWLFVRSVSKFLGPDYRLAIALGDDVTIDRISRQHALGPRWVSRLIQRMARALWESPETDRLMEAARAAYRERRAAFLGVLEEHGIAAQGRSGVHIWVPVRRESDVAQAMLGLGWAVQTGEPFRIESPPAIRIGMANLTAASARSAAHDLARCLSGPRRFLS
jgi:DNA-binding transcriptional MocR family regulator